MLKASPLDVQEIDSLPAPVEGEAWGHWLALDEVWDPQNLGALVRSAYFLGIKVTRTTSEDRFALSTDTSTSRWPWGRTEGMLAGRQEALKGVDLDGGGVSCGWRR